MRTKKPKALPIMIHEHGDKHFVDGVDCTVRFINNGMAWLFPTFDDADEARIARHIAFAKINEYGVVTLI